MSDTKKNGQAGGNAKEMAEALVRAGKGTAASKTESRPGVVVFPLTAPLEYEGEVFERLEFDLGGLKGGDYLKVSKEMAILGIPYVSGQTSEVFQTKLLARAARVNEGLFDELQLFELSVLLNRMQNFLMGLGF